jgi:hypothetical protein
MGGWFFMIVVLMVTSLLTNGNIPTTPVFTIFILETSVLFLISSIVIGIISLVQIAKSHKQQGGNFYAILGIVIGVTTIALPIIGLWGYIFPVYNTPMQAVF